MAARAATGRVGNSEGIDPRALITPNFITTDEVLAGLPGATELEARHGNGDLIRALDILGIAGPFEVTSPWELEDETGRHLINAGGYAALPFGEMYPPLVDFTRRYLSENSAMSLPQQSASAWRAALETNLVSLLAQEAPSHVDSQVFFSNSGAEAVEAALKFAKAARPGATYLINFTRSYHGKTAGALSLTPNEEYQALFRPLLPNVVTLPYGDAGRLTNTVRDLGADKVVAVVLEPIQGEGGVIHPPTDFLPAVNRLRESGVLVIADEIQTGLGRSGHLFASLPGGLEPDIITLAKPLGGGLVPVGATIARKWIAKKMLGGVESKRHSNTFGGGSLAMAVGLKSLEIIVQEGLVERSRKLGQEGLARLERIRAAHPDFLSEVRGAGLLFALQLQPLVPPGLLGAKAELAQQLGSGLALRALHEAGVHACYTLNSSRTVRLTPALNMPEPLLEEMLTRVEGAAAAHRKAWKLLTNTPPSVLIKLTKLALG